MTSTNTFEVNGERLWATIERSGEIGRFRGTGLRRLALSCEDQEMRDLLVGWAREAGCEMLSQAGHDAYAVADLTSAVMIFTPCRDGISHNTNEAIDLARTLPGANLLLNAAVRRANR